MTDPGMNHGHLTEAEQRQAELTVKEGTLADTLWVYRGVNSRFAHSMAGDLQAHLLEQALSPEAYRDWCRHEAAESMDGFMDGIHKMTRR